MHSQTPQLEGKNTLRRLFDIWEEPADNSMILCRHEPGKPHLVLHAGVLHGINEGSTFEIFRTDLSDLQHPLATATVTKVETSTSLLLPLDPTFLNSDMNRRVWYGRLLKASGFPTPVFASIAMTPTTFPRSLGKVGSRGPRFVLSQSQPLKMQTSV